MDSSPRQWIRLVHVCYKWRRIVFEAQQALSLRLFCTHGTPVLKTLDCWPGLPIVLQYGGSLALGRPTPKDEDNMMAALKQSDRVRSVTLTVTGSLLKKLSSIETPFSGLEDLILLSRNTVTLTLPSTFRWDPHLRCLHSTRITIPALLQHLYSSENLIDLQLHDFLKPSHFSPEALATALSGLTRLRSLSLHFLSTTSKYRASPKPSSLERAVLPVLTRFSFRGITDYLEGFVVNIDAPRLKNIDVALFDDSIFGHPKLSKFIDRIDMHNSHRRAYISSSEHAIFISLTQPGVPTCLKLQFLCKSLSVQIWSMARICTDFSAVLSNVVDLHIIATRPSRWLDRLYPETWLELLNSFTGVTTLHLDANHWTNVVHAMNLSEQQPKSVLPALFKLYIHQPKPRQAPLTEAVLSLMDSRRLCGHPIAVEYERICHIGTGTTYSLCHHRHSLIR